MKTAYFVRARLRLCLFAILIAGVLPYGAAQASLIPLGFVSFDVTTPGSFAQIDIINQTGPKALPPGLPVTTPVTLSGLNLVVTLSDGSSISFGQSDFVLGLDGLSYDGPTLAIGGAIQPIAALLTGSLSPTTISAPLLSVVLPAFVPASVTSATGGNLVDGDAAVIYAEATSAVPVPGTLILLIAGLFGPMRNRGRGPVATVGSASRFGANGALLVPRPRPAAT